MWHSRRIPIELRHFRSFVAVAEEGKISRAAVRLYITQPALSRQIQQLEREVGVALLLRNSNGVELTLAGREFLEKAQQSLEAADEALAVGRDQEPLSGRLALGHPLAGGRRRWLELSQAFADRYPAVEVDIREAASGQLQQQVLARELDATLALVPDRLDGLKYLYLGGEELAVWLHEDHVLAGHSELTLEALDGQELVLLGGAAARGSGFNDAIRGLFTDTDARPRFLETHEIFPPSAALTPTYLSVTVPMDFPERVVRIPLVPRRTLPFVFVRRADSGRAVVRAYGAFAAEHFASGP